MPAAACPAAAAKPRRRNLLSHTAASVSERLKEKSPYLYGKLHVAIALQPYKTTAREPKLAGCSR